MAIFKCKMCGDDLDVGEKKNIGTCQFCGSTMTLPRLDDDRRANLYDRANHFPPQQRIPRYKDADSNREKILRKIKNDQEIEEKEAAADQRMMEILRKAFFIAVILAAILYMVYFGV